MPTPREAPVSELRSGITAIVPARNEEANIVACVTSLLLQPEIVSIIVIDDASSDRTPQLVGEMAAQHPTVRLISSPGPPSGWTGKNYALMLAAQEARSQWLLFTDADAQLLEGATARALQIAAESGATLISFSPEQTTTTWYEKALIPFVFCRLSRKFSFAAIGDPQSPAAAANGQFLMIARSTYDVCGGHAAVAGEVLEDLAIARRVKASGQSIFFGPGKGIVLVRMYRTFQEMWNGWRKNLYPLVAGSPWKLFRELESAAPWIPILVMLAGVRFPFAMLAGVWLLIFRQMVYGGELRRNQYPFSLILYYIPGVLLYLAVLCASYRSHVKGSVEWKGRKYAVAGKS